MSTIIEEERAEWHRRIEDAPLDHELRQVFADWLLGHGDPNNDKHGLWLRSTTYRAQDVVTSPALRAAPNKKRSLNS